MMSTPIATEAHYLEGRYGFIAGNGKPDPEILEKLKSEGWFYAEHPKEGKGWACFIPNEVRTKNRKRKMVEEYFASGKLQRAVSKVRAVRGTPGKPGRPFGSKNRRKPSTSVVGYAPIETRLKHLEKLLNRVLEMPPTQPSSNDGKQHEIEFEEVAL